MAQGDSKIVQIMEIYFQEAEDAKRIRMDLNSRNFESYHARQDYSHKQKGQSKEFLPKQSMAVEQLTSFIQQGLIDGAKWYQAMKEPGATSAFQDHEIDLILGRQLKKNDIAAKMADMIKLGLLGSLMIVKVGGIKKQRIEYRAETKLFPVPKKVLKKRMSDVWQLDLSIVRQQDYYPDPKGKLYEIEEIEMDFWELKRLADQFPNDFDSAAVSALGASFSNDSTDQREKKARETDQNPTYQDSRKRVRLRELWGNILDPVTGELLHENVVCRTVDQHVVSPPKENPLWHGESPYVVSPIIRVPHSTWHKALMDNATCLNEALNEVYNLMLDGGMSSVFGIRQIRPQWLSDPSQISNGTPAGTTLEVNNSCPPGEKVLERVDTGTLSAEAINIYNLTDRELTSAALSNDVRLGNLPQRQVKATEIVAAQNSLTSTFNGIIKVVEAGAMVKILEKSWLTIAQFMDDLDDKDMEALLGPGRAQALRALSKEERFAASAQGHKFRVFGLSSILNKVQDFQKFTALLQTIGKDPILFQEFSKKYSMTKFMGEIVKSLDIDEQKILASQEEMVQRQQEMAMAQMMGQQNGDQQSQVPQVANMAQEVGFDRSVANQNGISLPGR